MTYKKSMAYRGSHEFCTNAGKQIRDQQYGNMAIWQ